jgi:hypothetical protein
MTDLYEGTVSPAQFEKDVAEHEMTIEREDGVFRNLLFKRPRSSNMHFRITTWPGYLCFSGDMGCFVFSRTPDMFEFFGTEGINPGYWQEKLQAATVHGNGVEQYSESSMREGISDWMNDWEVPKGELNRLKGMVFDHLKYELDNEHTAGRALYEFDMTELNLDEDDPIYLATREEVLRFEDFNYNCGQVWTYRYIWCRRALVWAIGQYYTKKKAGPNVRAAS